MKNMEHEQHERQKIFIPQSTNQNVKLEIVLETREDHKKQTCILHKHSEGTVKESMVEETKQPEAKKAKMVHVEESDMKEWPEAWLMADTVEDQKAPNRQEPNVTVSAADLKELGIAYWKMDADAFEYPIKSVPWDPKDSVDPRLNAIRDERGYSYADIITVHPDHLPGYEEKVKSFFEEHIHDAEEIRYVLGGSGYFDVRNKDDKWVRVHVKKGDLMTLPEGIYHRFTTDEADMIHAMRLFVGQPVWTPFNRPCEDHPSRKKFVESFLI